jgi:hypothetical protein
LRKLLDFLSANSKKLRELLYFCWPFQIKEKPNGTKIFKESNADFDGN